MAKVMLRDLKNKPHVLTLADGKILRIGPKSKVVIDKSQVTDTIKNEAKAGILALSILPEEKAVASEVVPEQAYKENTVVSNGENPKEVVKGENKKSTKNNK